MIELLLVIGLVLNLLVRERWRHKLLLTIPLFLLALFYLDLNSLLIWTFTYSACFYLDYLQLKLKESERNKWELEFGGLRRDLEKMERKLKEMEEVNKQLQAEVTKITKFFDMNKELTKVMYLQQLPPILSTVVKGGLDVSSIALLIFREKGTDAVFLYPRRNVVEFKEGLDYPFIDERKIISDEEAGFYDGDVLEPIFVRLGYQPPKGRMYIIPLISEGKMNGLLMFEDLGEDKTDIAHTFAGFLSLTLRKIKLYEQIQELAIMDELTRVFVKRHFLKVYSKELKRIEKMGKEACFMMLDLDRFKNYNDTFGHLVGDVILRETARLIKENIREVDLVGRYGGEEFCVFLPDTSLENGIQVGERIRRAIQYHTYHAYDETLRITISIGIACFPHDAKDEMELIDKADLALYYAKRKGRNKVIAYSKIK